VLSVRVFQAEQGDCLMLEYGEPAQHILVDGGPGSTYDRHLRPYLEELARNGHGLERIVLSHVDSDHVGGLLKLTRELTRQMEDGQPPLIEIGSLWHNWFEAPRLLPFRLSRSATPLPVARSIGQGDKLAKAARALGVPINPESGGQPILVDTATPVRFGELTVRVIGPSRQQLADLEEEWREWLERQARRVEIAPDTSVPNLSSITLLVEDRGGGTLLLTGDARQDHILEGLTRTGLLGERLHVSVLKMPHHGSERNMTPEFLARVTADTYVISANGDHGNPDHSTLRWIVEAARESGRRVRLVVTNRTRGTQALLTSHPPEEYGYELVVLERGASHLALPATEQSATAA
jgi:hypothetical protein